MLVLVVSKGRSAGEGRRGEENLSSCGACAPKFSNFFQTLHDGVRKCWNCKEILNWLNCLIYRLRLRKSLRYSREHNLWNNIFNKIKGCYRLQQLKINQYLLAVFSPQGFWGNKENILCSIELSRSSDTAVYVNCIICRWSRDVRMLLFQQFHHIPTRQDILAVSASS